MLEQPAGDFPQQRVLGRDARFGEQGNGIKRGEHRPASLLKPRSQDRVLLQPRYPVDYTGVELPLRTRLPDAAKQVDQAAGLRGQRARGAESLRLPALLGLGPRGHKPGVRLRVPETSQIRKKSHELGLLRRGVEVNDASEMPPTRNLSKVPDIFGAFPRVGYWRLLPSSYERRFPARR